MRYGRYGISHLFLRLGLGLTFLYVGVEMLRVPDNWLGYLPQNLPLNLTPGSALQLVAIFNLGLSALFLSGNLTRFAAFLATLHLATVLVMHGLDSTLFRNIGLLGATIAMTLWPQRRHYKKWWHFGKKKKKKSFDDEDED